MQSIPVAMTWAVLSRGRWALVAATAGAIAFPALILLALQNTGPLDPRDTAIVTMHCAFTQFSALLFCVAILQAQGPSARTYAFPITTSTFVMWQMLPAMFIVVVQSMVTTFVLNGLFDLNWPVWGPALFLAVAVSWTNAICWLMEKSLGWQIFALSAIAVALFIWFQWHYGYWNSSALSPIKYWDEVSVADALSMVVFVAVAYATAVVGVARSRRGEPPISLGVLNWVSQRFASRRVMASRSATAAQAYFRCEWQRKGWVMPAAVLFGLVSFSVGWLLFSRDSNDLMIGFLVGGGWLILAGILGGIPLGNTGRNDSSLAMRHFTAALPISDQELARTTLRTTAASTLFAWLLWAVAFALSYTVLATMGAVDLALVDYPKDFHWWAYLPATLLGIWVAASTVTAIGLADLSRFWLKAFVTLIATIILLNILDSVVSHLLPLGMADLLIRSFVGTFLGGVVFTTAGMFAVARSHQMVPSTSVWLVTAAAIAVAVVACIYWPAHLRPFWLAALVVAAAYSLAVAPLAAFPLAISANRHR